MRTTMLLCLGLGCAPTEKPGTGGSAATDTDDGTAETTATQGELDTGADSSEGWVPPPPISEHTFEAFALWASPIEDVVAAGREAFGLDFSRAISDLCAHEDRLWIGYGDANVNLGGVVPITFRSFASADDSTVLVGATSGEEQVERFRRIDGGLWMPGVDSLGTDEQVHFPLIGGNMYTLDEPGWTKHNTVPGGEHVHDVASWDGAAWAVGSGADNRDEFETGQIHRYLWRSLDGGESWMTMQREPFPEPGSGDTRYVHLLPQADGLYLFGYEYNWVEGQITVVNSRFDGWDLRALRNTETLEDIYPFGTLSLTPEVGLVWGVDVDERTLRNEAWVVEGGVRQKLDALDGRSVIDMAVRPDTGELLVLSYTGDLYGDGPSSALSIHLASVEQPTELTELLAWTTDETVRSVEFFGGALFLGTAGGAVLRAPGSVD